MKKKKRKRYHSICLGYWVECGCGRWWCRMHGEHVIDCECRGLTWWMSRGLDPRVHPREQKEMGERKCEWNRWAQWGDPVSVSPYRAFLDER